MSVVVSGGILTSRVFERRRIRRNGFDRKRDVQGIHTPRHNRGLSAGGSQVNGWHPGASTGGSSPSQRCGVLVRRQHRQMDPRRCDCALRDLHRRRQGDDRTPRSGRRSLRPRGRRSRRRRRELLGCRKLVALGHTDGALEDVDDFRRELVRQIRQVKARRGGLPGAVPEEPGVAPGQPHHWAGDAGRGVPMRAGPPAFRGVVARRGAGAAQDGNGALLGYGDARHLCRHRRDDGG